MDPGTRLHLRRRIIFAEIDRVGRRNWRGEQPSAAAGVPAVAKAPAAPECARWRRSPRST